MIIVAERGAGRVLRGPEGREGLRGPRQARWGAGQDRHRTILAIGSEPHTRDLPPAGPDRPAEVIVRLALGVLGLSDEPFRGPVW